TISTIKLHNHHTLFFSSAATHYSHVSSSVFFLYTLCSSSISTHSIYAGIFTSSSSAVSTLSNYTGISSCTYHSSWIPYSKLHHPQDHRCGRGLPRTPSLPSPPSSSSDGLSARVVIGIAIRRVALLVRRNEEETKKILTTFLFHLLRIPKPEDLTVDNSNNGGNKTQHHRQFMS
ncbi:unnamed protein product, partial [Brassica napus]